MLNQHDYELVRGFLREYKDRLANDGCNDWEFPETWSKFSKEDFIKRYHAWNGDPEEYNPKRLRLPNFAVVSFLAHKMSIKNGDYSIKIRNKKEAQEEWVLGYLTKQQQEDLVKIGEYQPGPYLVKFSPTGIGTTVKVFGNNDAPLLDLTDYDSW